MPLINFILSFALVVSSGILRVVEGADHVRTVKVLNILSRLEAMALNNLPSSGLTLKDVSAAHLEFLSWPIEKIDEFRAKKPQNALLLDLVLYPMDRFEDIIGHASVMLHQDYVIRMEKQYKRFRPGYFGQTIDGYYIRSPKVDKLIQSLRGAPESQQPLTGKMFVDAKKEFESYKRRIREIAEHEDIYSVLDEYKNLMNAINREPVLSISQVIFPFVKPGMAEQDVAKLKQSLVGTLAEKGYPVKSWFFNLD